MRLVYLLLGCLMLGFCSMAHRLPDNSVAAQESVTVEEDPLVKPLTEAELEEVKRFLVEGKKPKPPKPPKPDRHHRHDDDVAPDPLPEPVPIPPKPKPEPDPNFNKVRPLPPHVGPVIPVPDIKPVKPGFIVWLLSGGAGLVRWALAAVCVVAVSLVLWRFGPRL